MPARRNPKPSTATRARRSGPGESPTPTADCPLAARLAGFPARRKYLVGVSGGADSIALLAALREAGFRRLVVCHFSHGMRPGAAAREARFVRRAAAGFGFRCGSGDVPGHARACGLSLETAARELRFRFFEGCARAERCARIFLGHHALDQFETVLLNLFRGSGLGGLRGMVPESRVGGLTVHRPFLDVWPEEIRAWLGARKIRFLEDPSNTDRTHARNRLRAGITPAIVGAFGKSALRCTVRAAGLLRADADFIEARVPVLGDRPRCEFLAGLPEALRNRAILRWLRESGVPEPGSAEVARVAAMAASKGPPAKINLPGGFHARRRASSIFLQPGDPSRK